MQGASFTIIGTVDHLADTKTTQDQKLIQPLVVKVAKNYKNKERVAMLTIMTIDDVAFSIGGLQPGDPVMAMGSITSREYQDKNYMSLWANTVVRLSSVKTVESKEVADDEGEDLPF